MRQTGPFLLMVAIAVGVVAYLRPSGFHTLMALAANWEKAARSSADALDAAAGPRNADDPPDDEPRFPGEPARRRSRPARDWQDERQDNGTRAERRPDQSDNAPPPRRSLGDSDAPLNRSDERAYGWQPTTPDGQSRSTIAPSQRRASWPEDDRRPRDEATARDDRPPVRDMAQGDRDARTPRDVEPPRRVADRRDDFDDRAGGRRDDAVDERRGQDASGDPEPGHDDAWRPAGTRSRTTESERSAAPPGGLKRLAEEGMRDREPPSRQPRVSDREPFDSRNPSVDRRDDPPREASPAQSSPRRSRWRDADDLAMRPSRENPTPTGTSPAGIARDRDDPAQSPLPNEFAPRGRGDDAPAAPPARNAGMDRVVPAAVPNRNSASNPWDRPDMPDSPIAGGPIAGRQIDELESSRILAKVGPEAILARDCMFAMAKDRVFGVAYFREEAIRQKMPPEAVQPQIEAFMKRQLKGRIDTKLLVLDAKRKLKKEQMSNIQREVAKMFDNEVLPKLMKEAKLGSQRELDAHLASQSASLELCRQYFSEIIMSQQWLREQVKPNESIGHNDMLAYYHAHAAQMELSPSRARWEQLTVLKSTPDARAKLAAMGNRVLDGVPLAEVAKAESQGPGAASGGQQDWVKRGSLVSTTIDKALFSLPVGQLSPILEDDEGFHIIRVIQREESSLKSFADPKVQSEIRAKIKEQRSAEAREAYLVKLRAQIPVWTVYDNQDPAPPPPTALGGRNGNRPM